MKRTALKRTTGLARSTKPLPPRSEKRIAEDADHPVTRERVFSRDKVCQVYAWGYSRYAVGPCFGPPTFHHRRKSGQGGGYTFENGVQVCLGHNEALEADADLARWAHSIGLVVRRGDDEWASLGR